MTRKHLFTLIVLVGYVIGLAAPLTTATQAAQIPSIGYKELQEKWKISIETYDNDKKVGADEIHSEFWYELDEWLSILPKPFVEAIIAETNKAYGKVTIRLKFQSAYYGIPGGSGLYGKGTIILEGYANSTTFLHEFGHMAHEVLSKKYGAGKLRNEFTALNNGVNYGINDSKVFAMEYASTSYEEDFAVTFELLGRTLKDLESQYPYPADENGVIKKVKYIDALIKKVFPAFANLDFFADNSKPPQFKKAQPLSLGINIAWQPSDNSKGYNIYRANIKGEKGDKINLKPVFGGGYIDANADSNTTYYYTICGISEDGQGDTPINDGIQIEATTGEITGSIIGKRGFMLMQIGNETMNVNGEIIEIDPGRGMAPLIKNGRTLLPIRAIVEAMNGNVGWEETERKVNISALGHSLEMWLGRKDMTVDGNSAIMDVPPEAINGRTMLPLRFVAENVGCLVEWLNDTKEVVIVYPLDVQDYK